MCIQLKEGYIVPRLRNPVQNISSEFFQKLLWSSITKFIIDLTKAIREKRICDSDKGVAFPVKLVNDSDQILLRAVYQVDESDVFKLLTKPKTDPTCSWRQFSNWCSNNCDGKTVDICMNVLFYIAQSSYSSSSKHLHTVRRFHSYVFSGHEPHFQ